MTFISYAQNAEDVILYRALGHVAEGFYVDVGAQDPVNDSVTRAFYDRGWHGINVEPVPRWFERLKEDRPRDINVQAIVGDSRGVATIREVGSTGLSTVDEALARRHSLSGHMVREFEVPATTLDDLCRENGVGVIHFLKVDVEGHEAKVLAGMGLVEFRPWVVLVEATAPNSQVETHAEWEPGLLSHGYAFVYADGLNRFYVAREKYDELKGAFRYPPNFFDDYERMSVHWLRHHAERLERDLEESELARDRLLAKRDHVTSGQGSDRDQVIALRVRFRRLRAERALLSKQLRAARDEGERVRKEFDELLGDARSARAYRSQLFVAEEALAEHAARIDLQQGEIANLREYVRVLEAHARDLEGVRAELELQVSHWRGLYEQILRSSSWRLTRPFRVLRRLGSHRLVHGGRREFVRKVSGSALHLAARVPLVRRLGRAALHRMPRLRGRIVRFHGLPVDDGLTGTATSAVPEVLSSSAAIYAEALRSADARVRSSKEHGG